MSLILIRFNADDCLSYLLFCPVTREAMIIDATFPEEKFLQALENNELTLKFIVDTHTHADHASAGARLAEKTHAPYLIHQNAGDDLAIPTQIPDKIKNIIENNKSLKKDGFLKNNEQLKVGRELCQVFHTPGHTTDSVSIKAGHLLFTGDFLLINQCGRADLPGGSADDLYKSIFNTLLKLPEDTVVYPAHDYMGNINTSLGYELINNSFLQERSPEQFVAFVSAFFPPLDAEGGKLQCSTTGGQQKSNIYAPQEKKASPVMQEMCFYLEAFLKEAPPDFDAINSDELHELLFSGNAMTMLDVREPEELEKDGYLEKALNIPIRELPESSQVPADKEKLIVIICRSSSRSSYAALYLRGLGYKNVKILEGGMLDWLKKGYPVRKKH